MYFLGKGYDESKESLPQKLKQEKYLPIYQQNLYRRKWENCKNDKEKEEFLQETMLEGKAIIKDQLEEFLKTG